MRVEEDRTGLSGFGARGTRKIVFSKHGNNYIVDLTPGLDILLFRFEPNQTVNKETITQEDVKQYLSYIWSIRNITRQFK